MYSYLSDRLLQFVFVIEEETRSHLFICLSVGQERLFSCEIENDKFHLPHHSYHYMNKGNWNTGTARNKPGLWLWTILTSVWNVSISIVSISIWFLSTSLRNSDDDELWFLSFSNAIVHGRGKEKTSRGSNGYLTELLLTLLTSREQFISVHVFDHLEKVLITNVEPNIVVRAIYCKGSNRTDITQSIISSIRSSVLLQCF